MVDSQLNCNRTSNIPTISRLLYIVDKITSIIQSWNLKFGGSLNGLNIESFIYRVESLTRDTFNDDFTLVSKNLQVLLSGKAIEWY